jgi:hypothetical protein
VDEPKHFIEARGELSAVESCRRFGISWRALEWLAALARWRRRRGPEGSRTRQQTPALGPEETARVPSQGASGGRHVRQIFRSQGQGEFGWPGAMCTTTDRRSPRRRPPALERVARARDLHERLAPRTAAAPASSLPAFDRASAARTTPSDHENFGQQVSDLGRPLVTSWCVQRARGRNSSRARRGT